MVEVVIKYLEDKQYYYVYEPTSDTLMAANNLSEALIMLNDFLLSSGMSKVDILGSNDISYHIDSQTMKAIVEGNLKLLKRLQNAPSGFMMSNQRFGQPATGGQQKDKGGNYDDKKKQSSKNKGSGFQGATGFKNSFKKFGSRQ